MFCWFPILNRYPKPENSATINLILSDQVASLRFLDTWVEPKLYTIMPMVNDINPADTNTQRLHPTFSCSPCIYIQNVHIIQWRQRRLKNKGFWKRVFHLAPICYTPSPQRFLRHSIHWAPSAAGTTKSEKQNFGSIGLQIWLPVQVAFLEKKQSAITPELMAGLAPSCYHRTGISNRYTWHNTRVFDLTYTSEGHKVQNVTISLRVSLLFT
jgi:hypothetical protein